MRLIDADALIERIKIHKGNVKSGSVKINEVYGLAHDHIIDLVNNQPTAYDVEKVVAEIKKKYCQKCRNILGVVGAEEYCKEQKCEIDELCDIVKRGGVE